MLSWLRKHKQPQETLHPKLQRQVLNLSKWNIFSSQDLVNRRISMDMMLEMTRNQTTKQFIFLTPQDMRSGADFLSFTLILYGVEWLHVIWLPPFSTLL